MDDIYEKKYQTGKAIKLKDGRIIPILDIPFMSDEEWNRTAIQQAVDRYKVVFGKEPESEEEACEWHKYVIDNVIAKGEGSPWEQPKTNCQDTAGGVGNVF